MADSLKDIEKEISSGLTSNLYLIYGCEHFLVAKYFNIIKNLVVDESNPMSDMNYDFFNGDKVPVGVIADAFSTLSFSNDRRFVGVKDSGLFARGRSDSTAELLGYLDQLDESCVLVFDEKDVDKRGKLYKYLNKNGKVFELSTQSEKYLQDWVLEMATKTSTQISKADASHLINILSFDMFSINSEFNKLVDSQKSRIIKKEDIDLLVSKSLEVRVFELIDALSSKNTKVAIEIYANMLEMKESPLMILSLIGRQFKLMLECKILMEKGLSKDSIAKKLSTHPFVIQKSMNYSKNFTKLVLYKGFEDVLKTDVNIKSGKINDKLGVELILLKYCNL